MSAVKSLENKLNDVFVKQAPALPPNGKKIIVQYLPWINLVIGLLTVWTVYVLWNWAHTVNTLVDYANQISAAYGGTSVDVDRLTVGVWVALAVLAIEAVLYLAAFPALRARKKSGWNLLFYALLINIVYGFVIMFTDYGAVGSFIWTLITSAIGLYFLFQIRASYSGALATAKK